MTHYYSGAIEAEITEDGRKTLMQKRGAVLSREELYEIIGVFDSGGGSHSGAERRAAYDTLVAERLLVEHLPHQYRVPFPIDDTTESRVEEQTAHIRSLIDQTASAIRKVVGTELNIGEFLFPCLLCYFVPYYELDRPTKKVKKGLLPLMKLLSDDSSIDIIFAPEENEIYTCPRGYGKVYWGDKKTYPELWIKYGAAALGSIAAHRL